MSTFQLKLCDATHHEIFDGIRAFVGEDRSGSFGILAGHARIMASLSFGLARFCPAGGDWQYVAVPGALLYFRDNVLTLCTRHYLLDHDYTRIVAAMSDELLVEEEKLRSLKESLYRMEEEALRRMWRLGQGRG